MLNAERWSCPSRDAGTPSVASRRGSVFLCRFVRNCSDGLDVLSVAWHEHPPAWRSACHGMSRQDRRKTPRDGRETHDAGHGRETIPSIGRIPRHGARRAGQGVDEARLRQPRSDSPRQGLPQRQSAANRTSTLVRRSRVGRCVHEAGRGVSRFGVEGQERPADFESADREAEAEPERGLRVHGAVRGDAGDREGRVRGARGQASELPGGGCSDRSGDREASSPARQPGGARSGPSGEEGRHRHLRLHARGRGRPRGGRRGDGRHGGGWQREPSTRLERGVRGQGSRRIVRRSADVPGELPARHVPGEAGRVPRHAQGDQGADPSGARRRVCEGRGQLRHAGRLACGHQGQDGEGLCRAGGERGCRGVGGRALQEEPGPGSAFPSWISRRKCRRTRSCSERGPRATRSATCRRT